jgi:hypothetical protein
MAHAAVNAARMTAFSGGFSMISRENSLRRPSKKALAMPFLSSPIWILRLLAPLRGAIPFPFQTGGIASLNPRLFAVIPPG